MKPHHLVRSLFAAALLALGAAAQLPSILITLSPVVGEAGHPTTLKIHGAVGDKPYLLVSGSPGATDIPGIGLIQVGLGADFAIHALPVIPASGVLELSCSPECNSPVLDGPCYFQVVTVALGVPALSGLSNLAVLDVASGDCGRCAREAQSDPVVAQYGGGHAFVLGNVPGAFVFAAGGELVERGNGYAHLAGVIARSDNPNQRFVVDLDFTQSVWPGEPNCPPAGSPKLELLPTAYTSGGGPIEPANWHYYEQTSGYLFGQGEFAGAVLSLARLGPAFQVGIGANGKNAQLGASGWLDIHVVQQPANGSWNNSASGDINIDLGQDCGDCASKAVPDAQWSASKFTHSFYLPEIGKDFCFEPGAEYVEYADGSAHLGGTIRRTADAHKAFLVDVTFTQRVNPGAAVFPPTGSPKKSLDPAAYIDQGGPIDPSTWHYFELTTGTLTGIEDYAGGVLKLKRDGPAFQVGWGANDKNLNYGASGWLIVQILSQPSFGASFPLTLDSGDINIDLSNCP